MRKSIAINSAKLARLAVSAVGHEGTSLPGLVAEKIDPGLLTKLAKNNFSKGVIVVTGTNGKTTASKMIADVMKSQGISFIRNQAGSNMPRGIITTILQNSDSKGRCEADMALFEVDEAYVPAICLQLKPKIVTVTNLFRDQLDRYGELDSIATSFKKAFSSLDTTLILNADDPLVASLGRGLSKKPVFFGVSDYTGETIENDNTADSIFDSENGEKLQYLQRYFGHIGIYSSKVSKFKRPTPNVELVKMHKLSKSSSNFDVKTSTLTQNIQLKLPGLYNIYNSLAAYAVCKSINIDDKAIASSLASSNPAFGRGEELPFGKKRLQIMLIKNPTGFNQIIQTFLKPKPQTNPVLFCINDNIADGRDVSWLWDSALEDIAGYRGKVIVSGTRAYDMALRLKYAGFKTASIVIEPDIEQAIQKLLGSIKSGQLGYILPTYTAMLKARSIISQKSGHLVKGISQ
jgi:UDP-N-acetylmuramyl tripeptide synthase